MSRNLQKDEKEEEDEDEDSPEEDTEAKKEGEQFDMISTNDKWVRILYNSMCCMTRLDDFQWSLMLEIRLILRLLLITFTFLLKAQYVILNVH